MKNMTAILIALLTAVTFSFVGCTGSKNYDIGAVSGKVTSGGQPVVGLRVNFAPQPVGDNYAVGPWSSGVTDAVGKFTLETRYKENGAVIGKHDVSFEYDDAEADAMEQLQTDLREARNADEVSAERVAEINAQIEDLEQKLKGRPRVSEELTLEFEVPKGGTTEANFDLPER